MEYTVVLAKDKLLQPDALSVRTQSSLRWTVACNHLRLLLLGYTAGGSIDELEQLLPTVIANIRTFIDNKISPRSETPPRNEADTLEITQLDAYVYVFWLLALSKLMKHDEFIPQIMKWVDKTATFNRGRDILFKNVVQALTGSHVHCEKTLFHPIPYKPLGRATDVPPDQRAAYVKEFVESWYKGMKPTYWHGSHTGGLYFGYWCLEAALVTVLFDIDDSSYRDDIVYPKDLVDWYRAHSDPSAKDVPPVVMLQAKPGEPCPRGGEWSAPFLKKTIRIETGQTMPGPELDSSGNAVTWYRRND
ncbi:PoNe immunity protein domain-containing protein [Caballeronia sp. AZ10_KS36]|uniref:PoNe immunity protein domain-containing protein n=1 Tax=Caballeronia sp. AZ10_KS36 TaxID=2921757 RepID=UPI002027DFC6|nr:PoNe immunity protein domain-containing protein [Caballeronia sp. AZ10_KS36]